MIYLPLSFLDGKKAGDKVIFKMHGQKVILTCKDLISHEFKDTLEELKTKFAKTPNYHISDRERLVWERILTLDKKKLKKEKILISENKLIYKGQIIAEGKEKVKECRNGIVEALELGSKFLTHGPNGFRLST